MNESIIKELRKELKEERLKYEVLRKRYALQNDELCRLKTFISEVLNENKYGNTKTRTSGNK